MGRSEGWGKMGLQKAKEVVMMVGFVGVLGEGESGERGERGRWWRWERGVWDWRESQGCRGLESSGTAFRELLETHLPRIRRRAQMKKKKGYSPKTTIKHKKEYGIHPLICKFHKTGLIISFRYDQRLGLP